MTDALDRMLVALLQRGIPVEPRPFRAAAALVGVEESDVVERVRRMLESGALSRFGPMYNADRFGGAFTLAAMAVPPQDMDRVVALVNAHPEVAHNYEREHELNMWFVIAGEGRAVIDSVIAAIQAETGLEVLSFPKEAEYFIGLELALETPA